MMKSLFLLFIWSICLVYIPLYGYTQTSPEEEVEIIKNKERYPNYVLVAAHRGYWADFPENSQGEMAVELGEHRRNGCPPYPGWENGRTGYGLVRGAEIGFCHARRKDALE